MITIGTIANEQIKISANHIEALKPQQPRRISHKFVEYYVESLRS